MPFSGRIEEKVDVRPKLDVKDKKILAHLVVNSRTPHSEIAKRVLLSRDSVAYRIQRLQNQKVILCFFPLINYYAFGYMVYHVFLMIDERYREEYAGFLNALHEHPRVLSLMEYNDRWDLQISFLARHVKEFDHLMTELTSRFPNLILEKDVLETITNYKIFFLPYYLDSLQKDTAKDSKLIVPDGKDIALLHELTSDTTQSTYVLGKTLHMNADTVSYRMKKLVEGNVIKRYTTLINFSKLGYHWYTFALQMKTFDHTHEIKFQQFVMGIPQIIRAVKTLGAWDILLYIVVEDVQEFHQIVKKIKEQFYDIIKIYDTWIAYKEHLYNPFPAVLQAPVT